MNAPEIDVAALRRLARGLLFDSDAADDVIQEAWLAALRRDPHAVPARGWLAGAVKRIALGRRREDSRRRARESLAARSEPDGASEDVLERLEVLRALLTALERLDEPYRAAVVMRYLDDLPPREIARRTGVPVDTARTHVRRGLERLRRDLDGPQGRGREALLGVLGPWFANEAGVAVTSASPLTWMGSLAMNNPLPIVVVLLCAAVGWSLLQDPGVASNVPGGVAVSDARSLSGPAEVFESTSAAQPAQAQDADADRTPVEPSPAYEVVGAILRGYGGDPIPGGRMRLRLHRGIGLAGEVLLERSGQADARGEFRFAVGRSAETVTVVLEQEEPGHYGHPTWLVVPAGDTAWGPWAIAAYPLDVEVSGQVLDAQGRGLSGARVLQWVYERNRGVRTDADGRFRFRLSSAMPYVQLRVEADGHAHADLRVVPPEDGPMTLEPVRLLAERRIAGRVLDAQGRPVVGAAIRNRSSFIGTPAMSDGEGRFQLGGIEPEREKLLMEVRHDEFATLELEVAMPSDPVDLRLDRGTKLNGRVRGPTGAPVSNAWIRLGSNYGPGNGSGTVSDCEGRFVFERVPSGTAHVWWWVQGFAAGRCSVEFPREGSPDAPVEIVLEPERVLRGRLLRPDGKPESWNLAYVADIRQPYARFDSTHVWTDAEGRFTFWGLPSGPLLVGATVSGFERLEMELADVGVTEIELRLRPAGKLAGRVIDAATGAPVPRFRLALRRPQGVQEAEQISRLSTAWEDGKAIEDPEGEWFVDEDMPEGRWVEVEVEAEGYAPTRLERVATAVDPDPAACVLALVRQTVVRGQVVDLDGAPVAGAAVTLVGREGGPRATTDGAGRFELRGLAAGETTLAVEAEGFARLRDGPFEVGGTPSQHFIQLDRGARVIGRVLGDDGQPLEGEQVLLSAYDGNDLGVERRSSSDAEGRFTFSGLALGTFDLLWERTLDGETWNAQSRRVDVNALEDVEANLGASGSATLRATIRSEVGLPTGTRVRVMFMAEPDPKRMREGGPKDHRFSVAESSRTVFVTGDHFEIRGLEPGVYMLAAHAELDSTTTHSGLVRQIEIKADQQIEAEVLLKAPPR